MIALDGAAWNTQPAAAKTRNGQIIGTAIYQSLLAGGFLGMVVTGADARPQGIFEASYFLDLLRLPMDRTGVFRDDVPNVLTDAQILSRFKETQLATLLKNPLYRAKREGNKVWTRFDTPVGELLETMSRTRADVIVLTDLRGEYVGVVSRAQVMDQIVTELLAQ